MIKKIYTTLIIGLFFFYWSVTLIFVLPTNYISIQLTEYSGLFQTFFYQRWGFFAPPPKSNDRLYYVFINKYDNSKILTFEVIESLLKDKHLNAPFNAKEDLIDYLLSNSIYALNDEVLNRREFLLDQKLDDKKKRVAINLIKEEIKRTNSFKTLMKYSDYIMQKNNLDKDSYEVSFYITQKRINSFFDRNKKKLSKEDLIFDSKNIIYEKYNK